MRTQTSVLDLRTKPCVPHHPRYKKTLAFPPKLSPRLPPSLPCSIYTIERRGQQHHSTPPTCASPQASSPTPILKNTKHVHQGARARLLHPPTPPNHAATDEMSPRNNTRTVRSPGFTLDKTSENHFDMTMLTNSEIAIKIVFFGCTMPAFNTKMFIASQLMSPLHTRLHTSAPASRARCAWKQAQRRRVQTNRNTGSSEAVPRSDSSSSTTQRHTSQPS